MKIHIVSKDPLYLRELKKLVDRVVKNDLVRKYDNNKRLFFIDIDDNPKEHLSFAAKHNEKNKYIIILSKDDKYSIEAFKIHAWSYLLKPVSRDVILDEIIKANSYEK